MDLCLKKTRSEKSHDYIDVTLLNVTKAKLEFWNLSGSTNVLEKRRFCDGLLWTAGLTVEINTAF